MPHSSLETLHSPWWWVAVMSALVVSTLTLWGFVFLRLAPGLRVGRAPAMVFTESLIYGVVLFSISGFVNVVLGTSLRSTFFMGSAVVVALGLATRKLQSGSADNPDLNNPSTAAQTRWYLGGIVVVVLGSLIWSSNSILGLQPAAGGATLVPWVDFLHHARQIGNFAHFRGDAGSLNLTMYGERLAPYHYGSYMVSALISDLGSIPSIQIATSVYPVLGMVLTGAAMLILGDVTAGASAAFLAVCLLFFVPSLGSLMHSHASRWHNYFFFQQIAAGGAYAMAVIGLSVATALHGMRRRTRADFGWAALLFLTAAFFKIQLVLAYSVFFFPCILWAMPKTSAALKIAGTAVFAALYGSALLLLKSIPNAPSLAFSLSTLSLNIDSFLPKLHAPEIPFPINLIVLPVLVIPLFFLTYGLLFPVAIHLIFSARKKFIARNTLVILSVCLFSHACVRLMISPNTGYGDPNEINHKTFVLPYFMFVYGIAMLLYFRLSENPVLSRPTRATLMALLVAGISISAAKAPVLQHMGDSGKFWNTGVEQGLLDAAAHIRGHSHATDVVQLCENDPHNQFATFAERPVYISKIMVNAPPESAVETKRFSSLENLLRRDSFDSASAAAHALNISWLLVSPGCTMAWDSGASPVLSSNGYRLYRFDAPPRH